MCRDGSEAQFVSAVSLGSAEMRGEHQGRALFERVPQGWQRRLNPGVVPDRAICDRHIEIDTEQNALAGEVRGLESSAAAPDVGPQSPFSASSLTRSTHRDE